MLDKDTVISEYNSWFNRESMPVINCRILFEENTCEGITHIMIAEFNKQRLAEIYKDLDDIDYAIEEQRNKITGCFPMGLYKYFSCDVGNCISNWSHNEFFKHVFKILCFDRFKNVCVKRRFLSEELPKIKELQDMGIKYGNYDYWADLKSLSF